MVLARGQITITESLKGDVGEILTGAKMLFKDPTFKSGMNGTMLYNNSGGTGASWARTDKDADCPTDSAYMMRYSYIAAPTNPYFGGFRFSNISRANAVFVTKIIAKIPEGRRLYFASNAAGVGYKQEWLTPTAGTGKYETYLFKITCGASGTFSTTNFFYFAGGTSTPFTVSVAFATVYDLTAYDDTYDKKITEYDSKFIDTQQQLLVQKQRTDSLVTTVDGKTDKSVFQQFKSEINAKADGINLSVTEVRNDLNGLQITQNNLLSGGRAARRQKGAWLTVTPNKPLAAGKKYTIGFDVEIITDKGTITVRPYNNADTNVSEGTGATVHLNTSGNKRYFATVHPTANTKSILLYPQKNYQPTASDLAGEVIFSNIAIYEGDKDLGFIESPEEVNARTLGRNLLPKSRGAHLGDTIGGLAKVGGYALSIENNSFRISSPAGAPNTSHFIGIYLSEKLKTGQDYTVSFEAKTASSLDREHNIRAFYAEHNKFIIKKGDWQKFELSFMLTNANVTNNNFLCFWQQEQNVFVTWIRNIKVEYGNKATAWTEAPEDQAARIQKNTSDILLLPEQITLKVKTEITNQLGTRLSAAESKITQNANAIQSKVSQSTFDALGNRVTTAESKITQNANAISLKVDTLALKNTGVDIVAGKITLRANNTQFFDNEGNPVALFNANHTKIKATAIELEGSVTVNQKFKVLLDGSIEAVDGKFSGTISGVSGTFKSLKAVNDAGTTVGEMSFGNDGTLWFSGDMMHQGYNTAQSRGWRFMTSDLWCRGFFGAASRSACKIRGSYVTLYPQGLGYEGDTYALPSFTAGSETYYKIDLTPDQIPGMPIDLVLFEYSQNYNYSFDGAREGKTVRVVNIHDSQYGNSHIILNGTKHALAGGQSRELLFVGNMMTPYNPSNVGAGWILMSDFDYNWQ